MTTGDHIVRLLDDLERVNDALPVAERLVELRFHVERWSVEFGDFARELERVKRQVDDIWQELEEEKALTKIQGDENRELRQVTAAQRAWSGR